MKPIKKFDDIKNELCVGDYILYHKNPNSFYYILKITKKYKINDEDMILLDAIEYIVDSVYIEDKDII